MKKINLPTNQVTQKKTTVKTNTTNSNKKP